MSLIRKIIVFFTTLLFFTTTNAQDSLGAVHKWTINSKKIGEGKYELSFSGTISNNWQVYAPNQVLLDIKTTELKFADSNIIQEGDFILTGIPKEISSPIFENIKPKVFETATEWRVVVNIKGAVPAKLQGSLFYTYGKNDEFYPSTEFIFTAALEGGVQSGSQIKVATIDIAHPVTDCGDQGTEGKSLLTIFLLGLLGGLIALITPCVFPMIPVTVTFFTKRSTNRRQGIRNAVLYGLFIFLIYVAITIPFHIAGKTSPEIFNNISTSVWLNLLFFGIFVFFALSFFGLFEIGLPAGLANKADSKAGLGKIGGIFFMAATLTIVSFSCTGPILGTLLAGVAEKGAMPLTVGAAGFGVALGLPFALFAMFPNWLQSLPKSGGWMTDVKVILGFIELALAIKFLSNADLVEQWGLLKREIFFGAWIIIGICMVLYLLGIIKVKHSSRPRFGITRILFIAVFSCFTAYLIAGLLKPTFAGLISGFPPPRSYAIFPPGKASIIEPIHNDYEKALQLAKEQHKPLLIDFTGWACVNCRRMEEKVWTDKIVDSLMRNEFVVISLYVDERKKLPLTEQAVVQLPNGAEKSIVTVGDKWSTFQVANFGATSQPQYAIISPEQIALTKTKYYTPDPDKFIQWLECGLDAYKKVNGK